MMFGASGNPDHDDIDHNHPPRDGRWDQCRGHRRCLTGGESELIVGKALAGGRRETVVLKDRQST